MYVLCMDGYECRRVNKICTCILAGMGIVSAMMAYAYTLAVFACITWFIFFLPLLIERGDIRFRTELKNKIIEAIYGEYHT